MAVVVRTPHARGPVAAGGEQGSQLKGNDIELTSREVQSAPSGETAAASSHLALSPPANYFESILTC